MVAVSITAAHNVVMPATIQPGVNQFRVTTEAKSSGFQLVQLAAGYTLDQLIDDIDNGLDKGKMKAFKRFEDNTTLLGGVYVPNGKVGKVTLSLAPGTYYAADIERNRPSAFTAFTVAGADTGAIDAGRARPSVRSRSASWAKSPKSIPRRGMLTFENFSSSDHFVGITKLKPGKTAADFGDWVDGLMKGEEGPPPVNFGKSFDSGVVSGGADGGDELPPVRAATTSSSASGPTRTWAACRTPSWACTAASRSSSSTSRPGGAGREPRVARLRACRSGVESTTCRPTSAAPWSASATSTACTSGTPTSSGRRARPRTASASRPSWR